MLNTKEFYDIMASFEREAKRHISMGSQGLLKEDKELWDKQHYYRDGNVNNAFKMFLLGYSLGRATYNNN